MTAKKKPKKTGPTPRPAGDVASARKGIRFKAADLAEIEAAAAARGLTSSELIRAAALAIARADLDAVHVLLRRSAGRP